MPWRGKKDVKRHNKKCAQYAACRSLWLESANRHYRETGDDGFAVIRANTKAKGWLQDHGKYRALRRWNPRKYFKPGFYYRIGKRGHRISVKRWGGNSLEIARSRVAVLSLGTQRIIYIDYSKDGSSITTLERWHNGRRYDENIPPEWRPQETKYYYRVGKSGPLVEAPSLKKANAAALEESYASYNKNCYLIKLDAEGYTEILQYFKGVASRPVEVPVGWGYKVRRIGRRVKTETYEEASTKAQQRSLEFYATINVYYGKYIVERWKDGVLVTPSSWAYRIGKSGSIIKTDGKDDAILRAKTRSRGINKKCYVLQNINNKWVVSRSYLRGKQIRQNPDLRRRKLERKAQSGDLEAAHAFTQELIRSGEIDLTDYFSTEALNRFTEQVPYGRAEPDITDVPILRELLYYDLPLQYSWVRSHVITGLGRMEQGDILLEYILQQDYADDREAMRIVGQAIYALPHPISNDATELLRELLFYPLLSTQSVLKFVKEQNPANIPYLYELLQQTDPNRSFNMRILSAIGRSGVGPGRGRSQEAVDILREALANTTLYGPARVTAAKRLVELTRRLAIPYIEAAIETMDAVYDNEGNFVHWHSHHQHDDLRSLLRHINERFVLEREHCHVVYCTACNEEDRRDAPCQLFLGGSYCTVCSRSRQLWHY